MIAVLGCIRVLEEVKFLQKQRERKAGIPALPSSQKSGSVARFGLMVAAASKSADKGDGDGDKEDLVLQDTFAQETAVMVEDPNMYFDCVCCSCRISILGQALGPRLF